MTVIVLLQNMVNKQKNYFKSFNFFSESQTLPSPKNQSKIVCPGSYSPQRKFPSSALSSSKSQPDSLSTPKPQQKNNENGKRRGSLGSGLFKLFSRTHSCKEDSPNKNK